jgi:hypothetical protein
MLAAVALLCATQQVVAQNALQTLDAARSDSAVRTKSARTSDSRRARASTDEPNSSRRDAAEPTRIMLSPVTVSGTPGSLEVVGVPIPAAFKSTDSLRYQIVPNAGVRLVGKTQGAFVAGAPRPSSLMITVAAPTSAAAGRIRVASARFDGETGSAPLEVPIEMTVLAIRRVEVTVVDQLIGARRGDVATIRYRAVNFGNVSDSVTVTTELPAGWRLANANEQLLRLPVRIARDGTLRIWIPPQASPGTSMIRIVATSQGAIVAAVDARVEVENPNAIGSQVGPRLTVGSAFSGLSNGPTSSAYIATLEGQLSDSIGINGRATWRPSISSIGAGTDVALMRLGVPVVPASLAITSPAFHLGLGLTGDALSDLTGSYLSGTGISAGTRLGDWKISGVAARPYAYGARTLDSADAGALANARVEHAMGTGAISVTATHLSDPGLNRRLDAASLGAAFSGTALGDLSSELGYRRYAAGDGLGWSAELRRQTDNGFLSLRTMHAPGGAQAYARATDDFSAAASRRFADWFSLNAAFWQSGDGSSVFGTSSGSGWNAGPTFSSRTLGTNVSLQARGSSVDVTGQTGSFGNSETQMTALVDVHRGSLFANGAGSIGRLARTVSAADANLPDLTGTSSDMRGSVGTIFAGGTVQVDATTQWYGGSADIIPRRTTVGARAEHIALPLGNRMRVYAGAVVERLGFSAGGDSPLSSRFTLSVPLGFGFDVTASAERNPFLTSGLNGARGGWMTAIRIDHSQYLPRLVSPGVTHRVYRDVNGNGIRDRDERGFAGVVVRCGTRTVATDRDGRFKCDGAEMGYVDPRSLPPGWIAPGIRREQTTAGDIGLVAVKAVRVHIDLLDVDTLRVNRSELEKLVVVARDTANQPWLARDLGNGDVVFDALPPGRYTVDVDVSAIEEPLKVRGRPDFIVGERGASELRVVLTGRAVRIRTLPPTQSGGGSGSSGGAGGVSSDSTTGRARDAVRSSSKENRR